ncbi:MAG: hypothetical protein IJS12_01550 [Lachnospiraceae bacterium]|nr:hypothetical protein [Lachnospiraceae bacterium]
MIGSTAGKLHKAEKEIKEALECRGHAYAGIYRAPGDVRNIMKEIREYAPDLMITEDLEGFEMCTLTDAVSYNLIHCRQLHLLLSGDLTNERYLARQLSLLMTFVCPDTDRATALKDKYPDIPEITTMEKMPDDIPDEIKEITAFVFDSHKYA